MSLPETRIIISGGGTGGHVFPAIAIADALSATSPEVKVLFVGAEGRMETEKVPAAGYEIKTLWISGLDRSLSMRNLMFPVKLIHSTLKARKIIKDFNPHVVIGVGGYASGPTVKAAAAMKIPTLIQEQNSYPGITNKMLAKKAKKICVAYPEMDKYFPASKIVLTGNPVRKDIVHTTVGKAEAMNFFGFNPVKPVVLIIGGSLGARTINTSIHRSLKNLSDAGLQLIWQTGRFYGDTARAAILPFEQEGMRQFDFINRMDMAYAAADVVVSRAGALAVSELCITGKPTILVPSPNVAEDHQTKNAMALVKRNAAELIKDIAADSNLGSAIIALALNSARRSELASNIKSMARPNAAADIAAIIMELTKNAE
ncbi:MAG: undecaprenyldiphospho-muramoylpentapeptide beta-N-acetylglucosaminyltransferase [Lentimicrobium sp.]|jgi:UDP-N-acetylglucosamine--N-acetylmuramyl-(pentapeptide) pyrophosphoryl-undecaprenol N-acetylglucosamine transferase|nr:undecaprenyldiphospho-muramoylpentapeptide beta-N-acetylglucosaminyltransferase [Lentimicrobium sp.]